MIEEREGEGEREKRERKQKREREENTARDRDPPSFSPSFPQGTGRCGAAERYRNRTNQREAGAISPFPHLPGGEAGRGG